VVSGRQISWPWSSPLRSMAWSHKLT